MTTPLTIKQPETAAVAGERAAVGVQPLVSHSDLVELAAAWLRKRCAVVITELVTTRETPDAIGWNGLLSILVECKASYADFKADGSKIFRRVPELGMGMKRYMLAPAGVIPEEEIPAEWGLLEWDGKRVRMRKESGAHEGNTKAEIGLLLSAVRRIGATAPKGVSVRFYTYETKNTATLGMANS